MLNRYFSIIAWGLLLGVLGVTAARADVLDDIKKKGVLVVGTKADYRPFGFLDPQFLQQGKIDMMIATMSDTPERRKIVDIVEPSYYGSGTNVLAPKSAALKSWDQLRGKKVCLIQGAFYNKELQEKYGVEGVAFPGTAEAYAALKNGSCVGFAYDDTAIVGEMQKPEWSDYEMPLDSILFVPWGLAVKQGEKNLADFMSKTAVEWHKSGLIQDLEKKWGIKPTKFAQEMREKYK